MKTNSNILAQFFNRFSFHTWSHSRKLNLKIKMFNPKINELINYFLIKRIIIEPNFFEMYLLFTLGFFNKIKGFSDLLIKTCFEIHKIFSEKRRGYMSRTEITFFESTGSWIGKIFTLNHISVFPRYFSIYNSINKSLEDSFVYFQLCFLINLILEKTITNPFKYRSRNQIELLNLTFMSNELILAAEIFFDYCSKKSLNIKEKHPILKKIGFYKREINSRFLFGHKIYKNCNRIFQKKLICKQKRINKRKIKKNLPIPFLELIGFEKKNSWIYVKKTINLFKLLINYIFGEQKKVVVFSVENLINAIYFLQKYFFSNFYKKKVRTGFVLKLERYKIFGNNDFLNFFFVSRIKSICIRLQRYIRIFSEEFIIKNFRFWKLFLNFKNDKRDLILVFLDSMKQKKNRKKNANNFLKKKILIISSLFRPDLKGL